ncbi:exocrine gland-secreted peptide 1-like [Cricetulus griseus]|uniref:exocrine gland-secreted peptide 1-like n=1 Tax=Cricetulus griseus TaxID=10029 RepID=UPI000F73AC49|nr:exocrine gland-secreted peptide 1-like [Cricetulus griseus]
MLFLITLLLPSMLTEGRVLTPTQKEPTISTSHKTNIKTDLDKIEWQGEGNIIQTLESILLTSHQDQILFEDLVNLITRC